MGGTVTSNPNNDRQPVYYNGKAYIPETTGNFSYIKVGNHVVQVDLNDPTWFQQQVHGNVSGTKADDSKSPRKDWLKYFQGLIAQGKHDWTEAKKAGDDAAEERYTAGFMLRQIKAKHQALLAECHVKKDSELTGYQRGTADDYAEQIQIYTIKKKEAGEAESLHTRERISADFQIQTSCHAAQSEIYSRFRMGLT